jgi:RNA polymerase sigma-70 factor (ECF subfamily)
LGPVAGRVPREIWPDLNDPRAGSWEATDWIQIVELYDRLLVVTPTPIVALNRAIAVCERDGPDVALELVEQLGLDGYYLYHAARADMLERTGRVAEARDAYQRAIGLTTNIAELALLLRRRDALQAPGPDVG